MFRIEQRTVHRGGKHARNESPVRVGEPERGGTRWTMLEGTRQKRTIRRREGLNNHGQGRLTCGIPGVGEMFSVVDIESRGKGNNWGI